MGTGRSDDIDLAAYLPPAAPLAPPVPPRMPSALRAAARRPGYFDRAVVLDAGADNVIVVLSEEAGDADAIWEFIRKRMTGQNTGLM